jgi:hypothetical protein
MSSEIMAAILAAFLLGAMVSLGAVVLGAWIASRFIKTGQPLFAQEETGSFVETDVEDEPAPGRRRKDPEEDEEQAGYPTAEEILVHNSRFLNQLAADQVFSGTGLAQEGIKHAA